MKTVKKNLLFLATCVASVSSFAFGLCSLTDVNVVSAAGTSGGENFYIYGASVRAPKGEIGAAVKYHLLAEKSFYEEYVQDNTVNVKIIVAKNLGEGETVLTTQSTKVNEYTIDCEWTDSTLQAGYVEATAYFYNIPKEHYATDLAVAAEVVEGETVTYYTNQETASLAYVAWKSGSSEFDAYRPNYTVTFDNGTTATAKYGDSVADLEVAGETKTGYTFAGWDYEDPITSDISVKAKWSVDYTLSVGNETATLYNNMVSDSTLFDLDTEYTVEPELSVTPAGEVTYAYTSNNEEVATVEDGVVTAKGKGVATITVTAMDALTGETQSKDVEVTVQNYYEIDTEAEFDAIEDDANGYYRMTNSIAFTDKHSNVITFEGTFDGNGKNITGLNLAEKKGLFNKLSGAVIKNVNIIDAKLGNESGALAFNVTSVQPKATIIENVYVSVKDYGSTKIGGFVSRVAGETHVTNSCVYLPGMVDKNNGFVAGEITKDSTITNCVFIGGNGQDRGYLSDKYDVVPTIEGTTICSALEAHKTYKEKLGTFYEVYNTNHPYFALNNANFTNETFSGLLTSHIVELVEDITSPTLNLSGITGRDFSGVFDGNGHKISGLTLENMGLFSRLEAATIRNLVVQDVTLSKSSTGVFANNLNFATAPVLMENVYVSIKTMAYNDGVGAGAIANNASSPVVLSNVVVYVKIKWVNGRLGFLQGKSKATEFTLINCAFISQKDAALTWDAPKATGTVAPVINADENTGTYILHNTADNKFYNLSEEVLSKMSVQNRAAYDAEVTLK